MIEFLASDEKIVWEVKPLKVPYIFANFWYMLLSVLSAVFFWVMFAKYGGGEKGLGFFPYVFIPAVIISTLYDPVKRWLISRHASYILTNRRIIFRGGVFGPELSSFELYNIIDLNTFRNPVDMLYKCGGIRFHTGKIDTEGGKKIYETVAGVENYLGNFVIMERLVSEAKAGLREKIRSNTVQAKSSVEKRYRR